MSICEKLTVLAPWTRQAEMTVATMEAISMITPKMKIPGGPRHSSSYHHLIITDHKAFQWPLNGSRTPEMDSNQSGAVGGIILGVFQGSLTHLGASRRLRGQKYIKARPILGHILTFFDPPCQPGQIFLVQNSLYRCPTYSTTCFMLNSHLLGVF